MEMAMGMEIELWTGKGMDICVCVETSKLQFI